MTPEQFFEQASAAFESACGDMGVHERVYRIGGHLVEVRLAGTALVRPLTRAIDHLRTAPAGDPELTIMAWASGDAPHVPPPPDFGEMLGPHGEIPTLSDDRFAAHWMHVAGGLTMLDAGAGRSLFWLRDAAHLPYWETGAPFRLVLGRWLAGQGLHLVHAAAVGDERGAVLIAGPGGAGKSSTALACLESDLHFVSDDYVLLDPAELTIYGLYSSGKVDREGLVRLADLTGHLTNPTRLDSEKGLLFVHEAFPSRLRGGSLAIRAIVVPQLGDDETGICRPVSSAEALRALAPSTVMQSPARSSAMLEAVKRVVVAVPTHLLELGPDLSVAPAQLSALLPDAKRTSEDRVSVIVPARDPGPHLADALESIAIQEPAHGAGTLEVVLVDDGSDEDLRAVADRFSDRLDIRFERQPPAGPSAARNRGIALSRGDYVAFLDADDVWPAGSLVGRIEALRADPTVDVVHGLLRNFERDGSGPAAYGPPRRSFNLGSMLFRRRVFQRIGSFDAALSFSEDVDLLVRIEEAGCPRKPLDTVCLYYRRHEGSLTGTMDPGLRSLSHLRSWAGILKRSLDRRRTQARVTAIVVVKDGERYLGEALSSIRAQAQPVHQLVVVDGRSTDRTAEIATSYPEVEWVVQPGTGLADARNAGLAAATGDWIAFLDHDDRWVPDKLERQLGALAATPDAVWSLGQLEFFADDETGSLPAPVAEQVGTVRAGPTPGTLLFQREVAEAVGPFDGQYAIGCDLDWIQRLRDLSLPYAECPEVLLEKRLHGGNLSRRAATNRAETFHAVRAALKRRR